MILWTSVNLIFVSASYLFIAVQGSRVAVVSAGSVNICLNVCVCQSTGPCLSCVCLSVFVISYQSASKNHVVPVNPSINLMPYCIKHTKRCVWH